jgi:hypothetical protein
MDRYFALAVGIISAFGYGYYSRSYLGYFDTDILNLFFPYMIIYFMITKRIYLVALFNILFMLWYHSALAIVGMINLPFILYLIYKKEKFSNVMILISSIAPIKLIYKAILIALFFAFKKIEEKFSLKLLYSILGIIVLIVGIIYYDEIVFHIKRYLSHKIMQKDNYFFVAPMQFVAEAERLNIFQTAYNLSGNIYILGVSIIGYILMLYKDKRAIFLLPLIIFGILSVKFGIRFHIYGVVGLIIGYFYLFYFIGKKNKLILLLALIPPIYYNYKIIKFWNKNAKIVFNKEQINALKRIKTNGYAVTWWDYGWPIWYYTNLKTMIDNGRHHEDNYLISKIFFTNQKFSRDLICAGFNLFSKNPSTPAIIQLLNHKDALKNCKNSNPRYFIIPTEMIDLLYTIFRFSNINLKTGKPISKHIFHMSYLIAKRKNFYLLNDLRLNLDNFTLFTNGRKINIKKYISVFLVGNKKYISIKNGKKNGLIVLRINNKFYIIDEFFYNSAVMQLFLGKYDNRYFTPIYNGASITIYKVK